MVVIFTQNDTLYKEFIVLGLALLLFLANLILDYYVCISGGTNKSPIVGTLLEKGYQWAFGISSGLTIIIAEFISFFVLNILFDWAYPFTLRLAIEGFFLYIAVVFALNISGKWFLKSKGISINENVGLKWFSKGTKAIIEQKNAERGLAPNPDTGLKGFMNDLRANIEREKQKHKDNNN